VKLGPKKEEDKVMETLLQPKSNEFITSIKKRKRKQTYPLRLSHTSITHIYTSSTCQFSWHGELMKTGNEMGMIRIRDTWEGERSLGNISLLPLALPTTCFCRTQVCSAYCVLLMIVNQRRKNGERAFCGRVCSLAVRSLSNEER
jgi:hypothetical protein